MFHPCRLTATGFLFQRVHSTCCPIAWRSRVLFHSASAFLPRAPERHFFANGRVHRRRLFIYSARWPGVKERKCLFFCPLFPPCLSISVGPRHKVFQPLATIQPKNKPGEEKGTSLALSAPSLPSNPPPFFAPEMIGNSKAIRRTEHSCLLASN